MPNADGKTTAEFIYEEIICRHGAVNVIHTDQGTHFVNEVVANLLDKFQMKHHKITAYHPQANGLVEQLNGTIKTALRKIIKEETEWDEYLSSVLFAIRTHRISSIGQSPAQIEFGRDLRMPREPTNSTTIWDRLIQLFIHTPNIRQSIIPKL